MRVQGREDFVHQPLPELDAGQLLDDARAVAPGRVDQVGAAIDAPRQLYQPPPTLHPALEQHTREREPLPRARHGSLGPRQELRHGRVLRVDAPAPGRCVRAVRRPHGASRPWIIVHAALPILCNLSSIQPFVRAAGQPVREVAASEDEQLRR